jgi:hypothetical protein
MNPSTKSGLSSDRRARLRTVDPRSQLVEVVSGDGALS